MDGAAEYALILGASISQSNQMTEAKRGILKDFKVSSECQK